MPELQRLDEKGAGLQQFLAAQFKGIGSSLPAHMGDPARFTRIILTEFQKSPDLFAAMRTPLGQASIFASVMTAAQLGLEVGAHLGQAYLIPRKDKNAGGAVLCTFQIGYQGLIQLAYRAGVVSDIRCRAVYEGEEFQYRDGLKPVLIHTPTREPKGDGDLVAAYCVLTFRDGARHPEVMYLWELERVVQKAVQSTRSPMWRDWKIEGYLKTVLKRALRYCPKSASFSAVGQALVADDQAESGVQRLDPYPVQDWKRGPTQDVDPEPEADPSPVAPPEAPEASGPGPDPEPPRRGRLHHMSAIRENGEIREYLCLCGVSAGTEAERDAHLKEANP